MRILCLTARLPYPPDRGDRLRAYNFLRTLARHDHELTLLSFVGSQEERENVEALRAYCKDVRVVLRPGWRSAVAVGLNLWRPEPLQVLYYQSGAMQRLVDKTVAAGAFDAAYVHLFRMAPYLAKHEHLYRIVDLTDVISREVTLSLPYRGAASRLLYTLERPRIEQYEAKVAREFEEVWLVTEADGRDLAARCLGANIHVVSNGIDQERFFPQEAERDPHKVIFVGHMGVKHNIDAATVLAQAVLPLVQREIPECRLEIVGAEPGPETIALGKLPGVRVRGYVPDLNAALSRAAVFVAPLRFAAGIQNKILEAMATATPVVTTTLANGGLGARPGVEVLIGDDAETLAAQVVRLLRNEGMREAVGRAGLAFVRRNFSWGNVAERVAEIEVQIGR